MPPIPTAPTVYVRPPSPAYLNAIQSAPIPIDLDLALAQHAEYVQALEACNQRVQVLEPLADYPDACFMQDPALILHNAALICRMGHPARRGEADALATVLAKRFPLTRMPEPATLEGGDVLILPDRLLVGRSERTNDAGVAQLRHFAASFDLPVTAIEVGQWLHLLTAVTYIGHNTILVQSPMDQHPALAGLDAILVPPEEAYAANALGFNGKVVLPAGHPRTEAALRAHGFEVFAAPLSQFAAADGGVSCLAQVVAATV
jgi:dimethylargininase